MQLIDRINNPNIKFTKNDKLIIQLIFEKPDFFSENSILIVSKKIYISPASIVRFTKKIGLKGFKELQFEVKYSFIEDQFANNTSLDSIIDYYRNDYITIINSLPKRISENTLNIISDQLVNARQIYCLGIGDSSYTAANFSFRLRRFGLNSHSLEEYDQMQICARIAQKGDYFILFSLSGEKTAIVDALEALQNTEAISLLLTQESDTLASQIATQTLLVPHKKNMSMTDTISNQFGLLVTCDILLHFLFKSNPDKYYNTYMKTQIYEINI